MKDQELSKTFVSPKGNIFRDCLAQMPDGEIVKVHMYVHGINRNGTFGGICVLFNSSKFKK